MPHMDDVAHYEIGAFALSLEVLVLASSLAKSIGSTLGDY
jgi:hypothetical protein